MQTLRFYRLILILPLLLMVMGCATTGPVDPAKPIITDPFEPFNRSMYSLNKGLDKVFFKPVAQGYRAVTPAQARQGVGNFFSNLNEVPVFANKLLQARFAEAGKTAGRFTVNTTLGFLGLFDVATRLGISKEQGDFGQTLYVWGVKSSPYLVLPLLGPTTMRDGSGKGVDYYLSLWPLADLETQMAGYILEAINVRSTYLDQEDVLKSALDEYTFVRDIYIKRRQDILTGRTNITDWDEDLINEYYDY